MKAYKYLKIDYSIDGIKVFSSDTKLLDSMVEEVKKVVPTCEGKPFFGCCFFHKLQNRDIEIGFKLLNTFLDQGWEPFSASETSYVTDVTVHLRKAEEI